MITVHHLENSRSQRVLWLLEELGLDYEVRRYARDPKTMRAPPELLAVHPLGKSPVIDDDGVVVAETGAIVEYLTAKAGGTLVPTEPSERARYIYFLHYAEGSAMPPLLLKLIFSRLAPMSPWLVRPLVHRIADAVQTGFVDPDLRRHAAYWEAELGQRPWFCGPDFSAADIMMSFPLEAFASRGTGAGPRVGDWLTRIHARPAYQRALRWGGAYVYA